MTNQINLNAKPPILSARTYLWIPLCILRSRAGRGCGKNYHLAAPNQGRIACRRPGAVEVPEELGRLEFMWISPRTVVVKARRSGAAERSRA